jgi:hypothetical protein
VENNKKYIISFTASRREKSRFIKVSRRDEICKGYFTVSNILP